MSELVAWCMNCLWNRRDAHHDDDEIVAEAVKHVREAGHKVVLQRRGTDHLYPPPPED